MAELYIDYKWLLDAWGLGHVHVSKLPFANNYGAYFSARFSDIDLLENTDCAEGSHKQMVKGGRLKYYPPRFKLYACSMGIIRPTPMRMTYGEAQRLVADSKLSMAYTNHIIGRRDNGEDTEINTITYEQYVSTHENTKEEIH